MPSLGGAGSLMPKDVRVSVANIGSTMQSIIKVIYSSRFAENPL